MRSGPCVEVQKTKGSSVWYNAYILDITEDTIRVEFEDDTWPSADFPASSVRRCPLPSVDENFAPKAGDEVEVWVPPTPTSPSGWARGQLTKIKSKSFYFVALDGAAKGVQDMIVERDSLRRANVEPTIDASSIVRKLIPVDRELHGWIRSQDSAGCLNDVQIKGKLLNATCTHNRPDAKGPPTVSLVGDARAVRLGEKLLVEIHFKHQMTMQRFHVHRDKLMEHLSQRESQHASTHWEEFTVDSGFVGRIIGKKGENINRIKEEYDVNVQIHDPQGNDRRNATTITVSGASAEAVSQAREEMEFVVVKVPIEADQVGWVVGKAYNNLTEIAKKAELQYARFDDKSKSIELCGRRQQVEDAKLMISVHRDYLMVYQDMSAEQSTIQRQFEELDELDGKGGKRNAKGGKKGPIGAGRGKGAGGNGGGASGRAGRGGRGRQASEAWNEQPEYYEQEDYEAWNEQPAPAAARGRGANGGRRSPAGRGRKGRGK